jgi:hypothetical protein
MRPVAILDVDEPWSTLGAGAQDAGAAAVFDSIPELLERLAETPLG